MLPTLSPQEFVAKWRSATLKERSAAQEHFIDVCRLVGQPTPAEAELQRRTLTNLYNQRPTWLDLAHHELDHAVLDAYGWPRDLGDEEVLARLLGLNLERSLPSRKLGCKYSSGNTHVCSLTIYPLPKVELPNRSARCILPANHVAGGWGRGRPYHSTTALELLPAPPARRDV